MASETQKLRDEVAQLRQKVAELVEQMATEVRTRRLVVVEEDGFERIVAGASGAHGELAVHTRTADGLSHGSNVSLYVQDMTDHEGESVEVALWHRGNSAGEFLVHRNPDAGEATVELHVARPEGVGDTGMVLNSNGVQMHPVRVRSERRHADVAMDVYTKAFETMGVKR